MSFKLPSKYSLLLVLSFSLPTIPVQLQQGEELVGNNVQGTSLKECLSVEGRSKDLGVCFGNELLNNLHRYDEEDSFSLASGVSFVRDEKTPRDFGSFLDKDPMDFRSIMESTSNLISKRSLHWDMSALYPGLVMRIGPTLANGILEFVMDNRIKDRTYQGSEELSTGRLLAKNLLVPFLLGFKFQLSTLLPLILGLLLIASKKAFLLAKLAIIAVTVFGGGAGLSGLTSGFGGFSGPSVSSYNSPYTTGPGHFDGHHHHHSGAGAGSHCSSCNDKKPFIPGYYSRPHNVEYSPYYKEKSAEASTASPITPGELRDRLERLFITKQELNQPREDPKIRNARNFNWSPVN